MRLPADLSRPLRATATRLRLQRALDAGAVLALAGLGLAALVVALVKTEALSEPASMPWLWAAGALPVLGALAGALRPVDPLLAAKLLDRTHGLRDRVTNAVAFSAEPEPSPFMKAAIRDARGRAGELSPKRAMPLKLPVELIGVAGLGVGVAVLALLEVPRVVEETIVRRGIDPVQIHEDDLDAYESELRDLLDDPETPDDVRAAAREFNRLIEDLADERLDRAESLRRIGELEQRLQRTRPADADLMRESLEQLGHDMRRASAADELSQALQDADAERAEAEMRRLAERLRSDPPSRAELEQLRRALARAAEENDDERLDELRRREEEMNRLLQRQREKQQPTPRERRLLRRRERQLDRLRRQHREAMERRRQLDRLQREMNRAAESLNQRQQEQAADALDRGAEDLNRMAREQMSQEEMERLQQQLSQLREMLRRQRQRRAQNGQQGQGQQGQGQRGQSQMDRFVLRARGEGGTRIQMPGGQGQQGQGQGQQGQGQQGQQQGQGQQGQQGGTGGGQGGQQPGQGGEQQQVLRLGGEGEPNAVLEMPGMGQSRQGQGGGGQAQVGPGAGTGHDPTMLDDPTRLGGTRRNVRVEGEHGQGPSRSEVIRSSSQRGFADRPYRDVYTDYSGHAEEVLERDEVPPGYRFYVRRYFQLIRPREGASARSEDAEAGGERGSTE
ncbi:MAG TPA: hypothetical protein RMH99_12915 [Sandaracinaceae bacterium LLY-WYZ-13_1]|nr:hypothetical protein [Sandaracinaceae bacterium LLY-WYZ-13_1]